MARPADIVHADRAEALSALSFFNRVVAGEYEDAIERGLAVDGDPLTGCLEPRTPGTSFNVASSDADISAGHAIEAEWMVREGAHAISPRPFRPVQPNFDFREPFQNPDMRGRVTVQLFRLDSNGGIDPNLYTWTWEDFTRARDQVLGAFTFWVNQATARGISLSFRVTNGDPFSRLNRATVPTPTKYEPITRSSADAYRWVNDALAQHGYGSSSLTRENVYQRNEDFNRAKKTDPNFGPFDRSFSVYIVYNPGSAPTHFSNGTRAFALFDGPFTMLMWNSAGWGPDNSGRVLTHETGHIFWACDEYYDAPSNTGCFTCKHCFFNVGPRNEVNSPGITNRNCDHPAADGTCDVPRIACVMKQIDYVLCPHTP